MKEFIMRGQTASGFTHTINFSGHKGDYGFKLVEMKLYPSVLTNAGYELLATLTAAKVYEDPQYPNFDNEGLIATALQEDNVSSHEGVGATTVINDTFMITQDLILAVIDTHPGDPMAVNWQLKFMPVKLSTTEAALTNYRQFSIFDE